MMSALVTDIEVSLRNVHFTPKSGHREMQEGGELMCPSHRVTNRTAVFLFGSK